MPNCVPSARACRNRHPESCWPRWDSSPCTALNTETLATSNQPVPSNINVSLAEKPNNTPFADQIIAGGLAAGASQTVNFSWQTSASTSLGNHTLTASHNVTDDNAGNNSKSMIVTVNAPSTVTVTGITPNIIKSGATTPVVVTGTGFVSGAKVTFENGQGPVPTMTITSVSSTQIQGSVTAKSVPRNRTWDVRVTNPNGSTAVLARGLTITP